MTALSLLFLAAGACLAPAGLGAEVIGGREVAPHSRPFMASLQYHGEHVCGGALIHPQWVLTAAHCHHRLARGPSSHVVLGAHSLSKDEASKQTLGVAKLIPFSRFAMDPASQDIMLVKLHKPAQLSKQVQLLRPRPREDLRAGTKCQVAGWGATDPDGLSPSDTLREVTVTVISRKLCNSPRFYNRQPVITKGLVCAGDARGQKDSCQGDSGGPLLCGGAFSGLVSGGRKCGDATKPGVYTLLTPTLQAWIRSKLRPPPAE
ncbi:granzyme K [Pipistrellus kuhlii]|uniref:Granzyme K n=1 Tax=Pipistrellus kuhlii TaxID=59472 RepID=A0A7J7YXC1_PIPKU|nr:granzyme K [Pipistrellus kuhlii]KAF6366286.1 granzyme K [Pipistrellus kuhlii]